MSDVGDALETIADHSDDVFWSIAGDFGDVHFVSGSYEAVWGHSAEELRADPRSLLDTVYPPHRERVEAAIERLVDGQAVDLECRVDPAAEYDRWVWVEGTPVVDDSGNVEKIVGVAKDVTDRKHHEEDLALFQRMIDESNALVFVNDAHSGELTYANRTACETLGYDREALLGKTVFEIESEFDSRAEWEAHVDEVREEGRMRFRGEHERKDGSKIPVEVNLSYVDLDDQYVVAIARDISDRLERERELTRQNERLERLTSVASHDLRNPLNVASGRLELAREECESAHLDEVAGAIDRMDALIQDLLTLARSGQSIETTDAIDLSTLATDSWANVETDHATLDVASDTAVVGNTSRLKQVFENLFRNSVQHGGEDVTVSVGDLPDGFYVADDGPGIPEDDRAHVFEYGFTTADDGTGFGLAIVREIVEAHGWDVRVGESDAGGARFEITGVETLSG
ncbi:MAG: PAS domain S-box protein [Halanaeroarchaeum sp.]